MPHQLKRLARRVPLGTGTHRDGGPQRLGATSFLAFSTANTDAYSSKATAASSFAFLPNGVLDPLFAAVVETVEEQCWMR